MTLVTLKSALIWPGNPRTRGAPTLATGATLDAAGEYLAFVFQASEAMTISHVGFKPGTATGSPIVDVRIETLGTDGFPSGTLWATNTNLVTAAVPSNTYLLSALTASASIALGDKVCVKIAYSSGTSLIIQQLNNCGNDTTFPYIVVNSGTPTRFALSSLQSIALGNSSTTFYALFGSMGFTNAAGGTFNNTSSAKRGIRFTPTFDCRCSGLQFYVHSSVGDFNAVLLNDAGTELSSSSTAWDGDQGSASANGWMNVFFDSPVTLDAGTAYRAVIEPSSATNTNVSFITLPSSDYRSATPCGTDAQYTTFAGSWTDSTTEIPVMNVLIDQVDDGTGSGGGGGGGQRVISG